MTRVKKIIVMLLCVVTGCMPHGKKLRSEKLESIAKLLSIDSLLNQYDYISFSTTKWGGLKLILFDSIRLNYTYGYLTPANEYAASRYSELLAPKYNGKAENLKRDMDTAIAKFGDAGVVSVGANKNFIKVYTRYYDSSYLQLKKDMQPIMSLLSLIRLKEGLA